MPMTSLHGLLESSPDAIVDEWINAESPGGAREAARRQNCLTVIRMLAKLDDVGKPRDAWEEMSSALEVMSHEQARAGLTPVDTARWISALKRPLLARLELAPNDGSGGRADVEWQIIRLIDEVGLVAVGVAIRARQGVIERQALELTESSTPVVKLWEGILALPLIGTLDSARTQVVMESLLEALVTTGSSIAIIDVTGVPTIDTMVAQHLMKTVAAARLMGAECIISGIRPSIAQTVVQLGVDLGQIQTKATMADALAIALAQTGFVVSRRG